MNNEKAFPNPHLRSDDGITVRDYFAAKAMQGEMTQGIHELDFAETAARSYAMADAMLKERGREE